MMTSSLLKSVLAFSILALGLLRLPAHAAIFGEDDRAQMLPDSPKAHLARSTAVGVLSSLAKLNQDGKIDLETQSLSFLCPEQRFRDEPSLPYACSGFLVGPDLLVTAGHCGVNVGEVKNEEHMYCDAYKWLFDFQKTADGSVQLKDIDPSRYYHCKKIIQAVVEELPPFRDFALIQLDRSVMDRAPLKLAKIPAQLGDSVFMLGHPFGLPLKHTRNAHVIFHEPTSRAYVTNLDAFEGNSGSAVFNSKDEVIGILTNGTPSLSFVEDKILGCSRVNRCNSIGENCTLPDKDTSVLRGFQRTGSDVQKIAPIQDLLR